MRGVPVADVVDVADVVNVVNALDVSDVVDAVDVVDVVDVSDAVGVVNAEDVLETVDPWRAPYDRRGGPSPGARPDGPAAHVVGVVAGTAGPGLAAPRAGAGQGHAVVPER